jgi:hypothetical protein
MSRKQARVAECGRSSLKALHLTASLRAAQVNRMALAGIGDRQEANLGSGARMGGNGGRGSRGADPLGSAASTPPGRRSPAEARVAVGRRRRCLS